MPEIVQIPVADLLLDPGNPRFGGRPPNEQETALELAAPLKDLILGLAEDIVAFGLDPTSLPIVVPTNDRRPLYRVLEGNRRVLILKALDSPALVAPILEPAGNRKLARLAAQYERAPIETVTCVLYDANDEEVARHWVFLRHTGQNEGAGLVPWGPSEKARFEEAMTGKRRPSQQVIDFVDKRGELSEAARKSRRGIASTVERMVETTYVRDWLGLQLLDGVLYSIYPADELQRPLTRLVEDLKTGKVSVPDLYHAVDRQRYIDGLPRALRPKRSAQLAEPARLDDLATGKSKPRTASAAPSRRRKTTRRTRTTVIPKDTPVYVTHPRISRIYDELTKLSAEQYPNACAVLLRVFIELTVDHYLSAKNIKITQSDVLAKRLRLVAHDLEKRANIDKKVRVALETLASSKTLGPGVVTLHQYVHNENVYPAPADLFAVWDTVQPLAEQVWPA